jgi:hypothetical protein
MRRRGEGTVMPEIARIKESAAMSTSSGVLSVPHESKLGATDAMRRDHTAHTKSERTLRLAMLGLDSDQGTLVRAIVGMLTGRTRMKWTFAALAHSDAVIVVDQALGIPETVRALNGRIAIIIDTGAGIAKGESLSVPSPISVMNILDALDSAGDRATRKKNPQTPMPAISNNEPTIAQMAVDRRSLASTIARLVFAPHYRRIRARVADVGTMSICFNERRYHIDFSRTQLVRALRERRYVITALPSDDAHQFSADGPLVDLLWTVGLAPCVDFELTDDAPLRLLQWPNFPRLPHELEHVQLCGLMGGRVMSMRELVSESTLAAERVKAFLVACILCGYVQLNAEQAQMHELLAPARSMATGGLLERLLKRLGF